MADSPPATASSSSRISTKLSNVFGYFAIYFRANPTNFDLVLLFTGFFSAIASGIPFPLLGIIFGQLIDDFNDETCASEDSATKEYQDAVNSKILYVLYLAIAQFGFMYIHLVCWSLGGARLAQRLREQYLRSLLHKEPSFFDNLQAGEVSSRLNGDISMIRAGTSEKVGITLSSLSFFIASYVIAFIKNAKLAGILVSLVPAYFSMSLIGGYFIERYSSTASDRFASASTIASEALTNVAVVHAFNANDKLEANFSTHLQTARKEGLKKALANGIQAGLMYFIAYAANALAFWQGSHMIAETVENNGEGTTVGSVFTVIFILVDATLIMSEVTPFLHIFAGASASFTKLKRDMDHQSTIDGTSDAGLKLSPDTAGQFELQNVTFSYPSRPQNPVLRNVSLKCPAGKKTAIIGFSGSGKSTVASLMLRLYDPADGSVMLDGHDLNELNTRQVRSMIGFVPQEATLLDRSILENIAHGLVNSFALEHESMRDTLVGPDLSAVAAAIREGRDASEVARDNGPVVEEILDMVQKAAILADATRFIDSLPEGLGTIVGSSGTLLSGGQKQRVAIARALVKNPKVLILDEATAALDSKSEGEILAALEACSVGRTVISVAHRLSTIQKADKIIVMENGTIAEEGTHAELMEKQGTYAGLVDLQNLGGESDKQDSDGMSSSGHTLTEKIEPGFESSTKAEVSVHAAKESSEEESSAPEPPQAIVTNKGTWYLVKAIFPFIRPHALIALLALVGASIVGGAYSAEAVIFGNTVGHLTPCESPSAIRSSGAFFGLMFFILAIVEFFANIVSWVGFGWVSENAIYTIRVRLFRSLFEQDVQWHQSENRTPSSLLGYITSDGDQIAGLSGSIIGTVLSICINLVAAVILTFIVAWKIAIVCLAIVPLLLGVGLTQLRALANFEEKHENAFNKSVGISVEAVNSIKTIAALSIEDEILKTYCRTLDGPRREVTAVSLWANLWLGLQYFIGNLAFGLAFWWGSKQIFNGNYSQTQFIIVVFSLLVSAQLWSQMFALAPEVTNARAAIARVTSVIKLGSGADNDPLFSKKKDVEATAETKSVSAYARGGIDLKFRDVHFSYPARTTAKALSGLDLHVRPGQFCGLVGPSGAGKSTVISLVERMYTPSSGEILIDGTDITRQRGVSFRDDIALVPQEGVLFDGTVRFNLSLGARPGTQVSDEDMIEACKLANIHDTIMSMPDGYDTLCGTNGSKLSGGQKQRLAIARALVRKPRMLILDEPTSALDAESEKILQEGLEVASRGITVLAIAHRLHTIRKADVIYLIEAGKAVDAGTHNELYERSETYRANVLSQMIGEH
ncbi:Fc.00g072740.m01.CDS01 [Cosmosporella sp. VM-42]